MNVLLVCDLSQHDLICPPTMAFRRRYLLLSHYLSRGIYPDSSIMTPVFRFLLNLCQLAGFALIFYAPVAGLGLVGIAALGLRQGRLIWIRQLPWYLLITLAVSRLMLGDTAGGIWLIATGLLGLFGTTVLRPNRWTVALGITLSLLVALPIGLYGAARDAARWRGSSAAVTSDWSLQEGAQLRIDGSRLEYSDTSVAQKYWRSPAQPAETLRVSFEARRTGGVSGWDWNSSGNRGRFTGLADGVTLWQTSSDVGWISRNYNTALPLGGRTVLASLTVTSDTRACGELHLSAGDGKSFQVTPFCSDDTEQLLSSQWHIPEGVTTQTLTMALAGFSENVALTLQNVVAGELTKAGFSQFALASPLGLTLSAGSERGRSERLRIQPDDDWQEYTFEFAQPELLQAPFFWLAVGLERGLTLDLRNAEAFAVSSNQVTRLGPWLNDVRQDFLTQSPNLAGHSFAVLGLVLLSAVTLGWQGVLTILLTGTLVLLTGSRTALYVFTLGAVVLWSLRFIRQSNIRLMLFASLGLVLLLSAFIPARLSRMVTLTADGVGRPAIWQAALQESQDVPVGIGFREDGHLLVWNGTEQVVVDHAHNFWLEFLWRFGLLGGIVSLLFSGGLLWLGWQMRRSTGLLLVSAVLLLNVFDYTLFYAGVFVPLLIGLGLSQLPVGKSRQSVS